MEESKEKSKSLLNQIKSRATKIRDDVANQMLGTLIKQKSQEPSLDFKAGLFAMASDLETSVLFLIDQIENDKEPNLDEMEEIIKQKENSTIQ